MRTAARRAIQALVIVAVAMVTLDTTFSQIELQEPASYQAHTCAPGADPIEVEINAAFDVVVRNCSGVDVEAVLSLRYATPGSDLTDPLLFGVDESMLFFADGMQASHPIDGILDDLVDSIATATVVSWKAGDGSPLGETVQAQKIENPATTSTITATPALTARLKNEVIARTLISPQNANPDSCAPSLDTDIASVENRGAETLQILLEGRNICSTSLTEPKACDRAETSAASNKGQATLLTSPQQAWHFRVNPEQPPLTPRFDPCCDPQGGGPQAKVAVQCVRYTVEAITDESGVLQYLSNPSTSGWVLDIDPGDGVTSPPTAVDISCSSIVASSPPARGVIPGVGGIQDIDSDGVHDGCDYVVPSVLIDGSEATATLKRRIRNLPFNDSGTTFDTFIGTIDSITVGGVPATNLSGTQIPEISFDYPDLPPILATQELRVFADPNIIPDPTPSPARDRVRVLDAPHFIAMSSGHARPVVDNLSGHLVDLDPAIGRSIPVPPIPPTSAVSGVAFSAETNNIEREILIAGEDSVFLYDLESTSFLDTDGNEGNGVVSAVMGANARELVVEDDGRFAFVLHDDGMVGAVAVQRFDSSGAIELTAAQRLAAYPAVAEVSGSAVGLDVRTLDVNQGDGDPRFVAYVTSSCVDCTAPLTSSCAPIVRNEPSDSEGLRHFARHGGVGSPGHRILGPMASSINVVSRLGLAHCEPGSCEILPDPPPGGGGSGGIYRRTYLSIRILEANMDPNDPLGVAVSSWSTECQDNILVSSVEATISWPTWERLGVALSSGDDFSLPGESLYLVSPDTDELVIYDSSSGGVNRVTVGTHPFDVAVRPFEVSPGQNEERLYVLDHGDHTVANDDSLSIVDLADAIPAVTTVDLNLLLDVSTDLSLERVVFDGEFHAYLLSENLETVYALDTSLGPESPLKDYEANVGLGARQMATRKTMP